MEIQPIKTEQDYDNALECVETLMSAEPGSPEMDELDILATLINAYEENHFPIDAPDPIEAILFRMDQLGLSRTDLEPYIGGSGRVSEVLSRKRGLSLNMIRSLHTELRIPLENLIGK